MIQIRTGQAPSRLTRAEFSARFHAAFIDPAFRAEDQSIARLEKIAWQAYTEGRKAPFTQKAAPGYADPDYDLSTEWVDTKQRIDEAQSRQADGDELPHLVRGRTLGGRARFALRGNTCSATFNTALGSKPRK